MIDIAWGADVVGIACNRVRHLYAILLLKKID